MKDEHHCIQERKLGEMDSKIDRMDKELFNGEGGLIKIVPVLAKSVDNLNETVERLRTAVSGIVKYTSESTGRDKATDDIKKTRLTNLQMFGIVMAAIVGTFSIMSFIRTVIEDNQMDILEQQLHWKQDRVIDSTTRSIKSLPLDTTNMFK